MTATFVQSLGTAGATSSVNTVALTVTAASTAGNALILGIAQATQGSVPTSITDTAGNTYSVLESTNGRDPSLHTAICLNANPLSVGGIITVTMSSASSSPSVLALEFAGITGSVHDAFIENNTNAAGTTFDSGTATVPDGDHLLLAIAGVSTTTLSTVTITGDGQWVMLPVPATGSSFGRAWRMLYQARDGGNGTLRFAGTYSASRTTSIQVSSIAAAGAAPVSVAADAQMSSGSTLSADIAIQQSADVSIVSDDTLTASTGITATRSASLNSAGVLTATTSRSLTVNATLSGTSSLGAVSSSAVSSSANATFNGNGKLTATVSTVTSNPALSGTAALTATIGITRSVSLGSAGVLTASTRSTVTTDPLILNGEGTLAATTTNKLVVAAALKGAGKLGIVVIPPPHVYVDATLVQVTSDVTLTDDGIRSAVLAGDGTATVTLYPRLMTADLHTTD